MKYFLKTFLFFTLTISTTASFAQKKDTIIITADNLKKAEIKYGRVTYVVYNKKTKNSPADGIYLAKINIKPVLYNNKNAVSIEQEWDRGDTVIHSAHTVLNKAGFSTLLHETYWKRQSYSTKFDFETKEVSFKGPVADSVKSKVIQDFNESFDHYNLNWHSDLIIFTLLPYKENRVFKINFFDPGFGKASEEIYSVTGSDMLNGPSGKETDCWILEIKIPSINGYQKFWVDKKRTEVLKEEDFYNNTYRYKLKLAVSEIN